MNDRSALPPVLRAVIVLNVGMFAIELTIALGIGSVSLAADSIDFLEDAALCLLAMIGMALSTRARARLGMGLAAILVAPTVATLFVAARRLASGLPPSSTALGATACAALAVNAFCAWLLVRHRASGGSLLRAAYLSARNDVFANLAMVAAAGVSALTPGIWPDLLVGLGIAALNAGAAWEVWGVARAERRATLEDHLSSTR